MKLIRPATITDSILTAASAVETPPAAYNGGTTYALGDTVSVFGGVDNTTATIYESLQAGNTGNMPASSPAWWQEMGTAYLAYNAGTSYGIGAIVTSGHVIYRSLAAGNVGNPVTDVTKWQDRGATNRWAMFDQKTGTQTQWPGEVSAEFTLASGRVDTVGLINIDAASVNITIMDGASEVYNEDHSLVSTDGITDWHAYFFEEVTRKSDLVVTGLPNVLAPTITVSATAAGSTVSVGQCILGTARELGGTEYGASVGITDYSRTTQDDFGNWYFVRRGYSKRGRFTGGGDAGLTDYVFNILASYRAVPVLVTGSDEYTSTFLFGIFRDWSIALQYPSHSILDLEFQGI
jgi:hypothetical protein